MTELPPPRPPDAPPLGPPIRRPDDHLPRPESFTGPAPAAPAPPKRRLVLLVLALAGLGILIAAGSVVLTSRTSDDGFDTEAAATALDELLPGGGQAGIAGCPVDDVDGLLARAFGDVDNDAVYDTIDLGTERVSVSRPGEASSVTCELDVETPEDAGVSLVLSPDPDRSVEEIETSSPPGADVERGDEVRGGTVIRMEAAGDGSAPGVVLVAWADDELAVGVVALGEASIGAELDDLQAGFEEVLPDIVDELAGDSED